MQDMLSHGLALNEQALSCVVHALQSEGQVWKALNLLMLTNQVCIEHDALLWYLSGLLATLTTDMLQHGYTIPLYCCDNVEIASCPPCAVSTCMRANTTELGHRWAS